MAETLKVLGQLAPSATTLTDLYTVPITKTTVVSSLVVCNRGAATAFRASIAVANAADNVKQYIAYDTAIGANTTVSFVIGMTLGATDRVRCYATLATLSFSLFGSENG